ncbi:MAG: hypothetical protein KIS68_16210 [Bauldia sp.]|nr:hypothetical protein [Bauldia sp.]
MEITIPARKSWHRVAVRVIAGAGMLAVSSAGAQPLATGGRVIADAGRVRIAIEVPEALPHRAAIAAGTNVLNIDLPGNVDVHPVVCEGILASPAILGCSFGRLLVGYARLRIVLPGCGTIDESRLIEPLAGEPGQILVDVVYGRPVRCVTAAS